MNAYWKAILAALSAGGASLVASGVALPPWVTAVLSALVALGVVATVPNAGFVNLAKVSDYDLQEAGDQARNTYQERLPNTDADRGTWTNIARTVVLALRR